MNPDSIITPSRRIASRLIQGQALILDPSTDALQRLNEVGSFIWARITERRHTVDSIRDAMIAEFDVDEAQAALDLSPFLEKLADRDLIAYASD